MSTNYSPRFAPGPSRPFVNRATQLKLVEERLAQIALGGSRLPVILCFWGSYGVGKSWLIGEVYRRHFGVEPRAHDTRHITVVAKINVDPSQTEQTLWRSSSSESCLDRVRVIDELWHQIVLQVPDTQENLDGSNEMELASDFVGKLTAISTELTPIIVLDTVEKLIKRDIESFHWFEEQIVEKLSVTDRVLFVFAGRSPLLRWKRFQVRRRAELHQLRQLDTTHGYEDTPREFGSSVEVLEAIYGVSHKHPLMTDYVGTLVEDSCDIKLRGASKSEVSDFLGKNRELVQHVRVTLAEQLLASLQHEPDHLDLFNVAKYVPIMRLVNVEVLRGFLEELGLVGNGRGDAFYLKMIGQLQDHQLLHWDNTTKSYIMNEPLRRIMDDCVRENPEDASRYWGGHLACYRYYRGIFKALGPMTSVNAVYFREALYHGLVLEDYDEMPQDVLAASEWLEHVVTDLSRERIMEIVRGDRDLETEIFQRLTASSR